MKLPLPTQPEPTDFRYSCYNTGGVEVEVGEFLYGLVRMLKPDHILETGTHLGISASYMGLGLKENGFGLLTTIEIDEGNYNKALVLFNQLKISNYINALWKPVEYFEPQNNFDFIFLDTEPHLRFNEFLRFWHKLKPRGLIGIHDLNSNMGQTRQEVNGIMDWPFGTIPKEIKELMKTGELSNFHFQTPRGFYLGQKKASDFYEI